MIGNLDFKHIGPDCCRKLIEMKLPSIQKISLCKHIQYVGWNQIGDEGCHHLSQANWPTLQTLNLRKHI